MKLNEFLDKKMNEQAVAAGTMDMQQVAGLGDYELVKNPQSGTIDVYSGNKLVKQFPGDMKQFGQWIVSIFKNPQKAKQIIQTLVSNEGQKLFLAIDKTPDLTKTGEVNVAGGQNR